MVTAIVDVEGNGLLPELTDMWCIIVKPLTDEAGSHYDVFVPDQYILEANPSKLTLKPAESVELHPLSKFKEYSKGIDHWVGHNMINYDARAMLKLGYVDPIITKNITDTVILSQITQPNRPGGHSLKSWGMRFGDHKGDWTDFSKFDWQMVDYCLQDVRVTNRLYGYMQNNIKNFSKFSVRLEHATRNFLDGMEDNGFAADEKRMSLLYVEIKEYCDKLEEKIQKDFPPEKVYFKKLFPRFSKNGDIHGQDAKTIANNDHDYVETEFGEKYYHLYRMETFNPRSTPQIVERMNAIGWQPVVFNDPTENMLFKAVCDHLGLNYEEHDRETEYNKLLRKAEATGFDEEDIKGTPQVCEENFETLPKDAPESAKTIAEWFLYDKRLQKLDEWFRNLNPKTGCIHGQVFGCGARTHRMTHRNPNMANISKVVMKKDKDGNEQLVWGKDGKYATDMRACFTTRAPATRRLVGVDLAGIQLRAFAHYANDKDYSAQILSGDIHSYNREILDKLVGQYCKDNNVESSLVEFLKRDPKGRRDMAKTFIYAYLFGAGNKKVGSIFEFPEAHQYAAGKFIRAGFVSSISGLEAFKKQIKAWAKQGFMVALDGRLISLPSEHFALSIALQSFEAIVMKYSLVLALEEIKKRGLDALLVGVIHDESQWDVKTEHAEEVGDIVIACMEEAGRYFKSNLPLTGGKSIGYNWADSH